MQCEKSKEIRICRGVEDNLQHTDKLQGRRGLDPPV
jgi:hypothetical protein